MLNAIDILKFILAFAIIALASGQIGAFGTRFKLPLVSGFLFAGIIVGPYILNLIPQKSLGSLRFVDEISLAFIALAAGNELYLPVLRSRLRNIAWISIANVIAISALGTVAVYLLSDLIPFMQDMPPLWRLGISLIASSILIARSPSSAIAIIDELRAKGIFTSTVLGVTVIADVVVISVFAFNSSVADALFTGLGVNLSLIALLLLELLISLVLGYFVGVLISGILKSRIVGWLEIGLILLIGFLVFVLSNQVREYTHEVLSFEILIEPLMVCMIAGFYITNFSLNRKAFEHALAKVSNPIYILFFTLTGASLAMDVLVETWFITLVLFFVRLAGLFIGTYTGGSIAKDNPRHNRLGWMAYITQAGVGLGLAKEVAVEFPAWGASFATIMISVIVLNQVVGPPFFKLAIQLAGEARPRADIAVFDGVRDAIIFGLEDQSLALGRQLISHEWQVKVICFDPTLQSGMDTPDVPIECVDPPLDIEKMQQLGVDKADALVAMLTDEENYEIVELNYEHFGVRDMIVRLNQRDNFEKFHKLDALIVDPGTAIVSLLDHLVRSPVAASLILGMEEDQDIIDLEVRDPILEGVAIRDLRLPLDTLIISVTREGEPLISHGFTRLSVGDQVTVVGSIKSLSQITRIFDV